MSDFEHDPDQEPLFDPADDEPTGPRQRVSPAALLGHIETIVRAGSLHPDLPVGQLELVRRPESFEAANWWIDAVGRFAAGSSEEAALRRAVRLAQARYDVDWPPVER